MNQKLKSDSVYSTDEQLSIRDELGLLFENNMGSSSEKLGAFSKYVTRQDLSLFIARLEIFQKIKAIKGSIIECGVYYGGGLMTYAQLSAALEPLNYNRRIIGFDTFEGNKGESQIDIPSKNSEGLNQANYFADVESELNKCISIYDKNRFLNHIPKVELVRGDISVTVPEYIKDNEHIMISLLELTVNLYNPTKSALKNFLPRMCKGSIIAINTLNEGVFPGATKAFIEELDIKSSEIKTFEFCPNLSYLIL